jgi:hypothetical protein
MSKRMRQTEIVVDEVVLRDVPPAQRAATRRAIEARLATLAHAPELKALRRTGGAVDRIDGGRVPKPK